MKATKKIFISSLSALLLLSAVISTAIGETDEKGPVNLPSRVAVPNVIGSRLTAGIQTLRSVGLVPITQLSDRDGNARIIVRQAPVAGTMVMKGSSVNIYGQLLTTDTDTKGPVTLPPSR
jgi:beta-lactam-binding protein with PASTA domain